MTICSHCNTPQNSNQLIASCIVCGKLITTHSPAGTNTLSSIMWEKTGSTLTLTQGFYNTTLEILGQPSRFFKNINARTSLFYAILYGLTTGTIGLLFNALWIYAMPQLGPDTTPNWFLYSQTRSLSTMLLYSPMTIFATLFMISLYSHLLISITVKSKRKFGETFSTICYTEAGSLFYLIPIIGSLLAPLYSLYLLLVGISSLHQISKTKTVVIMIVPGIIIAAMITILASLIIGASLFSELALKKLIPFLP